MARIEGVNLPSNKRIEYGLPYLFGIGLYRARGILSALKIDFNTRVKDLDDRLVAAIQKYITDHYAIEGALRKAILLNVQRLQKIGSYRGARHSKGLPVYGQRTKTNARTRKGPRRAGGAIALKRKATKK